MLTIGPTLYCNLAADGLLRTETQPIVARYVGRLDSVTLKIVGAERLPRTIWSVPRR